MANDWDTAQALKRTEKERELREKLAEEERSKKK